MHKVMNKTAPSERAQPAPKTSTVFNVPSLASLAWGVLDTDFEYIPTRAEKKLAKPVYQIFYSEPLRLPRHNYNVPTLDQLFKREKLDLLRSCGLDCVETRGQDKIKVIEVAENLYGKCRYFTALKCSIYRERKDAASARRFKRQEHKKNQKIWLEEGGQQKAYYAKRHYGSLSHSWFVKSSAKMTGMDILQPTASVSFVDNTPATPKVVRPRWDKTSRSSDVAQESAEALYPELFYSPVPPPPKRSVMLLFKIRAYIRALRTAPMAVWNRADEHVKYTKWETAPPQSEGLNGEELNKIKSNNVVLVEENPASSTIASMPEFRFDWHQLCTTEKKSQFDDLTDRFTYVKSVEWKTSDVANKELTDAKLHLPVDFVTVQDGSMPILVPFKIFQYFKSDIEIKIHINSNQFQIGQLQFSWQYMEKYDENTLENIYVRSQLPHVLINAGASNEATMTIPYKYVQPFMFTHKRAKDLEHLYLGTLRCFVVVPLAVGTGGPDHCSFSYFIRFPNAIFTGMRDGSIGEPQMEAAAVMMVAGEIYNNYIKDKNCDNPSQNLNPQVLVPTASHSWCAGTGLVEKVHSLRMDNTTVGVGRVGIDSSETSIGIPCRTFGMLKHFDWSIVDKKNNASGSILWSCDVHAQVPKNKVYKIVTENGLDAYAYPPVSVVASLYKQWRGSLEFKFDIVCSKFHTGRLLIAYIPNYYGDANTVTMAQARNSAHAEFSLQDASSFVFRVPYIGNSPYWPRRYTGPHKYNEIASPSKIFVFVLNPLIPMQSIVNKVVIVPYIRAGDDFEVSVPVQPAIGLSDEIKSSYQIKDLIYPTAGSYPYVVSNYSGFGDGKKCIMYEGTAAFGTASTFHAPERELKTKEFYYGKAKNSSKQAIMKYVDEAHKAQRSYVGFIVLWSVPAKGNFGIPFPTGAQGESRAKSVSQLLRQGAKTDDILKYCYDFVEDDSPSSGTLEDLYFTPQFKTYTSLEIDWVMASPEMDNRYDVENMLSPTNPLASTSNGRFNFNETFTDLKDLARRYQLYTEKQIKFPKNINMNQVIMQFPIVPHGLNLDIEKSGSIFNLCRDGHIPIISSGYIYFRGSIRLKIVVSVDVPTTNAVKVWVQHHPDSECSEHRASVYPNIKEKDSFKSHSYSFYLQALDINSIIELEVPFYQAGMYGLTRKPSKSALTTKVCQYYSLGDIILGLNGVTLDRDINLNVSVYYSIGDDFSFNVFRGFPMSVFTDEVWPEEVESRRPAREIVWITGEPEMEEAQPEMMRKITGWLTNEAAEGITETVTSKVSEAVSAATDKIKAEMAGSSKYVVSTQAIANAVGNLIHVLANPTIKTIAIAIANVIGAMLCTCITQLTLLIQALIKVLSKSYCFLREARNNAVVDAVEWATDAMSGTPEGPNGDDDDGKVALGGLIFAGVASLVGVTMKGPTAFPDVLRGINGSVSLMNNSIRLIQNCSGLITYSIKYIYSSLYPAESLKLELIEHIPDIAKWHEECTYLLDARNKHKFLYDRRMMSRIYDASVVGNLLISSGLNKSYPGGRVVFDTQREIRKMQADLFERGAHPDVRFETYPIWLSGAPGIGKSFLTKRLANDLLKHISYAAPGSLIYDIPSGAKYWSGCSNPAVLVSDDLFQVSGTRMEDEIANIFLICSSSVLNPPMAAVEDKERRLNPLVYLMLCNHHFPNVSPTCPTPSAVYRRRKFLIDAELNPDVLEQYPNFVDASQLPRTLTANMGHLRFRLAHMVTDPETTFTPWMDYDTMMGIIKPHFKGHYENERQNFKDRMRDMYCLDPNYDDQNLIEEIPELAEQGSLTEQIEFFRDRINQRIDTFEDPTHEPGVGELIAKQLDKFKALKEAVSAKFQMEEPSTSGMEENIGADLDLTTKLTTPSPVEKEYTDFNIFEDAFPDIYKTMTKYRENFLLRKRDIQSMPFFSDPSSKVYKNYENYLDNFVNCVCTQVNVMQINLEEHIRHIMQLDKFDSHTWYVKNVNEIVFNSLYSLVDYMKFVCMFKNGPTAVACMINNINGTSLQLERADVKPACDEKHDKDFKLGVLTLDEYSNDKCKLSLKRALTSVYNYSNISVLNEIATFFVGDASCLFDGSDPSDKQILACIGNAFRTGLHAGLKKAFSLLKTVEIKLKDKLVYLCSLMAKFSFVSSLFKREHECECKVLWERVRASPHNASFCSVRGLLEYHGIEVKMCTAACCLYNNPCMYYLQCLVAKSCNTRVLVRNVNYQETAVPYEVSDVWRAIRKKYKPRSQNIFKRMYHWCRCFILHVLPEAVSWLYNTLVHRLPCYLFAIAATAGLLGISYLFGTPVAAPESNYFKFDAPKHPKLHKNPILPKSFAAAAQQGVSQRLAIAKRIERNSVMIYAYWIENGQRQTRGCRCLMLRGRSMLVLRHYIEEFASVIDAGFDVEFKLFFYLHRQNKICNVGLPWADLYRTIAWCSSDSTKLTSNYGIALLPNYIPQFKDIVSFFASYSEHGKCSATGDLYVLNGENSFNMPLKLKKNFQVAGSSCTSAVFVNSVYCYQRQYKGLCGSVLVCNNLGKGNGAIVGIHIAGNDSTGIGYAEPIYFEMFAKFFELFPQTAVQEEPLESLDNADVDLDSNLMFYGCVPKEFAHRESGKSKIIPSLLHNKIYDVKTEVNPLRPGDPRQPPGSHPLRDGCNKHGDGSVIPYDPDLVERVKESLTDKFTQIARPVRLEVKPLTLEQAVCGDVEIPYFESLNWKSSEGFPLSSSRPKSAHDKRWLFTLEEGQFGYKLKGLHPMLDQQLKFRDLCFKENKKPPTIYIDCLKDYRLSPEKCKIPGKTRIFSIAPIQCSIDIRMYINDFCASIKNSRIDNSIGIGINPDSLEWTKLVNYLFEAGEDCKIITLDYKNFGPSLMSQLVSAGNDVIVEWFRYNDASEEHVNRVKWLLSNDIVNPVHLCSNVVYQTVNGIASGSPLTGECNSIPNLFYIRLTYLEIMAEHLPDFATMYHFDCFVRLVVYGDDLIMAVEKNISDVFNAITIRDALARHGIVVTPAQKSSEMVPYTSIYEASFLKRTFRHHPTRSGVWLAPIELTSIEECLNWCHVSEDIQESTLECCRASLDLAYSQGPVYYSQHYNKIKRALLDLGLSISVPTWIERDNVIFGDGNANDAEPTSFVCSSPWIYRIGEEEL